ncbi:hypothetical protein Glove_109g200 [Diversispora epigaea]|uniref:Protein kinase domain-containing protein n=1 Tax=Diversispora epigaea TaxID=1348612 RepID=A0A397J6J6_9GLOM|nr:hypothetical protein Glove_109g200 [Diversispora epigaea]
MNTREDLIKKFGTWSSGNANIDKIIQESQIKLRNFERDCVSLKELKDYGYDILEFIKAIMNITIDWYLTSCISRFFGISKNPSTQNYIIVMESFDNTIHQSLNILHEKNLVHCDLHSRNISPGLCKLSNDLTLSSNSKKNNVYGSIPYISPEVLRGNEFTKEGDIYSFGEIMYEAATGNQPFADQVHGTYLMINICNGARPKVPDMMLNFIPECYLDVMYRCWNYDPSKRPTTHELNDIIYLWKIYILHEDFSDAYLNRKRMNKSHEQKLNRSL